MKAMTPAAEAAQYDRAILRELLERKHAHVRPPARRAQRMSALQQAPAKTDEPDRVGLSLVPPVHRAPDAWVGELAAFYRRWLDAGGKAIGPDPFEVMVAETEAKMAAEDRADRIAAERVRAA